MSVRIGINGFGRMGRLFLRAAWELPEFEFVHINEPGCSAEVSAHLLEFDSLHGRWPKQPQSTKTSIEIDTHKISYSQDKTPGAVPWKKKKVDIVFECSGAFRSQKTLTPYFSEQGVRKVIVAAPVHEDAVLNVVMGINDHLYKPDKHRIITAASCTTNCLAPVVKVVRDGLGIKHGVITTIHDITNTQTLVDKAHNDMRRARSALLSLIPTSTGSATAITLIYPELKGKLNGLAVRVPILNASLTDCVFELERPSTKEEVNQLFEKAAHGPLQGILGYEERALVSADYLGDTRSSIIDAQSTMVVNGTQLKVLSWYDNEIGYVHRMAELGQIVARSL